VKDILKRTNKAVVGRVPQSL